MVCIKTKMKVMPKSCSNCLYFQPKNDYYLTFRERVCLAAKSEVGLEATHVTAHRHEKCPLIEVD